MLRAPVRQRGVEMDGDREGVEKQKHTGREYGSQSCHYSKPSMVLLPRERHKSSFKKVAKKKKKKKLAKLVPEEKRIKVDLRSK